MSHPHPYKVLHQNEFGFVSQCQGCGDMQIALGNFLLSLPMAQFSAFVSSVRAIEKNAQDRDASHQPLYQFRPYLIKTPVYHLYVAFSEEEYSQALEVLSMAEVLFHTFQLLR
jgi:hypothetical protein